MAAKRRLAAAILAAFVFVAVMASLFIVIREVDHDCTGEGCPICAVIAVCQKTLKTRSEALAVFDATAALVCFVVFSVTLFKAVLQNKTPIILKDKLLN